MHLKSVSLYPDKYPTGEYYPFNLKIFHDTKSIEFKTPVTFFVGENGTGKSTLIEAIAHTCGIHIWKGINRARYVKNPYEEQLHRALSVQWANRKVPGSFFASQIFRNFAGMLDEWAAADPGTLDYFGGKSLVSQSHGQSLMSFFRARYRIKGLYFLDEPETALSPKSQIELLKLIDETGRAGYAQFIIATHSPIIMACPCADIYSFDAAPVRKIGYEDTEHYRTYKRFMDDRAACI